MLSTPLKKRKNARSERRKLPQRLRLSESGSKRLKESRKKLPKLKPERKLEPS